MFQRILSHFCSNWCWDNLKFQILLNDGVKEPWLLYDVSSDYFPRKLWLLQVTVPLRLNTTLYWEQNILVTSACTILWRILQPCCFSLPSDFLRRSFRWCQKLISESLQKGLLKGLSTFFVNAKTTPFQDNQRKLLDSIKVESMAKKISKSLSLDVSA